jgi:hypothetical protein
MATTIFAAVETGRRARLTALFSAQLLSLVVLLALPLGPWASPAMATTSNLITTNNGVLWSGCPKHAFTAYINNPYGAYGWTLDLKILDPTGRVTKTSYTLGVANDDSYNGSFSLCAPEVPGRFTITGVFKYNDQNYTEHVRTITPVPFAMRLPRTRTSLTTSKTDARIGETITLRSRSRDERPGGYACTPNAFVKIQRYRDGRWVTVIHTVSDNYGRVTHRFTFRGAVRWRAVTRASEFWTGSVSGAVRVY